MTAQTVGAAKRRTELDGLRGVAILLVLAAHALVGVFPSYRGLAPFIRSQGGLAGVQLFFVLSGYLITGILLRQEKVGLTAFWKRRAQRLYPVLLIVTAVAVVWSHDWWSGLRAVTYTENIVAGHHGDRTMSHAWSLAVEEQFYLVWPIVFVVAGRWRAHVAAVGIVATWVAQHTLDWPEVSVYMGLRWDALLAGCLLAIVGRRLPAICFVLGVWVLAAFTLGMTFGAWNFPLATIASVGAVGAASSVLDRGWLVHLGLISYPLYLWHAIIMRLDVSTPVSIAVSVVLAEATWRLVDRRVQRAPILASEPMSPIPVR